MILNFLRATILFISIGSFSAHAGLITSLSNINIGGTLYIATFHPGQSFNDLFDKNGDGIFNDNNGSTFNRAPQFWGNASLASLAASAVHAALPDPFVDHFDEKTGRLTDGYLIPHERVAGVRGNPRILSAGDFDPATSVDTIRPLIGSRSINSNDDYTYVTFSHVPTPSTLALISLALGIMGFMGRRRRV